jgi:hypothetical protein
MDQRDTPWKKRVCPEVALKREDGTERQLCSDGKDGGEAGLCSVVGSLWNPQNCMHSVLVICN